MAEKIGRLGYLGLAIEATPGTAESTPDIFVPFTENSLRGHQEPLLDNASHTSRVKDYSSVSGKKWGEGSVQMYLDSSNAGYLLKMAFGTENRTELSASPPTHNHQFTPTVSGNTVTSATLWDSKGVDCERYAYMSVDSCEIEISNDGIATINASLMGGFPSTVSAPALTVPSGYLYTWKDTSIKFGDTVQGARDATATPITNFKLSLANNLELTYETGAQTPAAVVTGPIEVTGSYTLYFESATDRDRYYNLTKKSLVLTLTGADLGSGYTEQVELVLKKVTIEDIDYETGLDDLFAITANFRAEWDQAQAGYVEVNYRNGKATSYT